MLQDVVSFAKEGGTGGAFWDEEEEAGDGSGEAAELYAACMLGSVLKRRRANR